MISSEVLTMPARFDFKANEQFNKAFTLLLNSVVNNGNLIKLDCSQMDYIDSAGIGLLVMSYKKSQKLNVKMSIMNVKKDVKDILLLANLQKLIEII